MIAVIVRLAMSVRENKRLLEQVRTDPLTGLVNRGGMQVDLASTLVRDRRAPVASSSSTSTASSASTTPSATRPATSC